MTHYTRPWANGTPSGTTACGVGAQGVAFADRVTDAGAWKRRPEAERCAACERAVKRGRA